MTNYVLPPISDRAYPPIPHFPTKMQAVIFRLWDMVSAKKLAAVLETTEENITNSAREMGLLPQDNCDQWQKRGYISIIKSVWHLLGYEQLCALLELSEEKLAFILREDDFLECKLGGEKPACEKIVYRELTKKEHEETAELKATLAKYIKKPAKEPFDFFSSDTKAFPPLKKNADGGVRITKEWGVLDLTESDDVKPFVKLFEDEVYAMFGFALRGSKHKICLHLSKNCPADGEYHETECSEEKITVTAYSPVGILRALMGIAAQMRADGTPCVPLGKRMYKEKIKTRYIYSFCGLYANAFEEAPEVSYPDALCRSYAKCGINGVFTQGVLYKLVPFPFDEELSNGWEKRLDGIRRTVKHLKKYGIKLYLYLNEPRSMPLSFFEKHPQLKGREMGDYASMCTSVPAVRQYLHDAVRALCEAVPDIGGFFLITCSENPTNCYSHVRYGEVQPCARCAQRKSHEVIAEVYNTVNRAAKSVCGDITIFANTWQWLNAFSREETKKCIELLDKDIPVLCISEEGLRFNCGGVENTVQDYTMSRTGPSELSIQNWKIAQALGHEAAAKVQINTTWECSTVPFIPVYELVREHMARLSALDIKHLMLSWTLGGYPSDNLKLASEIYFEKDVQIDDEKCYEELYGEFAPTVKQAVHYFCEAFSEFPFDIGTVYTGPHNAGVSNLLYPSPTGLNATMTCFCYDDVASWRAIYPPEVYERQLIKLRDKWKKGISLLCDMPECEFTYAAQACNAIFSSCVNQVQFVRLRDDGLQKNGTEIKRILESEIQNARELYSVMQKFPAVGYEAANHYYYTQAMLLEKILNCKYIEKTLCKGE